MIDTYLEGWIGHAGPSARRLIHAIFQEKPWGRYCPRCGQGVGVGEVTASGCGHCRQAPPVLDGVVRLGGYQPALRAAIHAFKYQRRAELARPLGRLLAGRLKQELREGKRKNMCLSSEGRWLVVPMPMPWMRRWVRGLDHAHLLAEVIGRELGLGLVRPLRKRQGRSQAESSRSARLAAQTADYRIQRSGIREFGGSLPNLSGRKVILVDDVLTTGRSMHAAGSILRRLGPACILAAVLAVTPRPD